MATNNDSRKRRRVTFEGDAEAASAIGRVDDRTTEGGYGRSSGWMNETPGSLADGDNVSTRRMGEVVSDASGAPRREDSGPFWQDAGRTDGRQGEQGGPQASTAPAVPDGVVTEADVLSNIIRLGSGLRLGSTEGQGADAWARDIGPHLRWPIGTLTARAVVALATRRAPRDPSVDSFLCNNICWEIVVSHSPTSEVWAEFHPLGEKPLTCDVCHSDGTHRTGRCAMVTSDRHGDTNTDPFCDCSCSRAQDRHGKPTHGLQRSQAVGAPGVQFACAKLTAHWEKGQLGVLFEKFVLERRRMGPLLVYTRDLCFIRLAIVYSDAFCRGGMPEALEGMWPYIKTDTIRHRDRLRRFYEIGMENMPAGELEGLSMADIRARYDRRGGIPPQCRDQT